MNSEDLIRSGRGWKLFGNKCPKEGCAYLAVVIQDFLAEETNGLEIRTLIRKMKSYAIRYKLDFHQYDNPMTREKVFRLEGLKTYYAPQQENRARTKTEFTYGNSQSFSFSGFTFTYQ